MEWSIKCFITVAGFLEAVILSGCLFGYPSLQFVMQEEGIYSDLCQKYIVNSSQSDDIVTLAHSSGMQVDFFSTESEEYEEGEDISTIYEETIESLESHRNHASEADGNLTAEKCGDGVDGFGGCRKNLNLSVKEQLLLGCDEQRIQMTLIYTFAAVFYGLIAVVIGLSLDKLGLRWTRIIGRDNFFLNSTLTCAGFIFLAYTTPERSYFLWPALNLLAIGTNQLRLAAFTFADLWPKHKATVLNCYSSGYSISTTLFLVIQLLYEQNVSMRLIFLGCAALSSLTYITNFVVPKYKIEFEDIPDSKTSGAMTPEQVEEGAILKSDINGETIKNGRTSFPQETDELTLPQLHVNNSSDDHDDNSNSVPVSNKPSDGQKKSNGHVTASTAKIKKLTITSSLCCLSGNLHIYWQFINLFLILFYSSTFNIWASKVTSDVERVSFYVKMSGLCCLVAPLFAPFNGLLTDKMAERATQYPTRVERLAYTMQAPVFSMFLATTLLIATMICKLFFNEIAIYTSMFLIALARPMVIGSCTSYIRMRFPAQQFNMLNGIFTTVISVLCFVQYPIMKWMTTTYSAYEEAHWLLLMILIGSLISPVHMMIRGNAIHYAKVRIRRTGG